MSGSLHIQSLACSLRSLDGIKITVKIPKQTEGSVGLLLSDVCFKSSPEAYSHCAVGEKFRTKEVLDGLRLGLVLTFLRSQHQRYKSIEPSVGCSTT